jgi:hypothetical protein
MSIITRTISHSAGQQLLQDDTTQNTHVALAVQQHAHSLWVCETSYEPSFGIDHQGQDQGEPGNRVDGCVWESLKIKALSSRAIQDFNCFLEKGK